MKAISGKGHFIFTISGLVAGDMCIVDPHNNVDIKKIASSCDTFRESGVARQSRRGWWTMEHPVLGLLQWKSGIDFRTAKAYFVLRVHGQPLVSCWPDEYGTSHAKWESRSANSQLEVDRRQIERLLGSLQNGTGLHWI
jgi:hypothetical protein